VHLLEYTTYTNWQLFARQLKDAHRNGFALCRLEKTVAADEITLFFDKDKDIATLNYSTTFVVIRAESKGSFVSGVGACEIVLTLTPIDFRLLCKF